MPDALNHTSVSNAGNSVLSGVPVTAPRRPPALLAVVLTEETYFDRDPDDPDAYTIEVTWRGQELYAVKHHSQVWNGKEWEIEPQPSSRTAAFRRRTRFDYDTAHSWAHRLMCDRITTTGR